MAQPKWLKKYLVMTPEVNQIYNDLEEWLNHCRLNLLKYDPADLYKSPAYKEWQEKKRKIEHRKVKQNQKNYSKSK